MKFLLDTNIIIPAEPTSSDNLEPSTIHIVNLLQALARGNHQSYIHSASINEIRGDKNDTRREAREILFRKYPILPNAPLINARLESVLRDDVSNKHDKVDHLLLAAVDADAVDYLITNDQVLRKKAFRLGLQFRVATPVEAISIIRALFPVTPIPPPAVESIYAHELNQEDPIFDSFKIDYPEFSEWLKKCKREHRKAWVIRALDGLLRGICIVKQEDHPDYAIPTPALKICSFKISEQSRGYRYGELLLKSVFDYTTNNNCASVFVETFAKHSELVNLLEDFGFQPLDIHSTKGELILYKPLTFSSNDYKFYSSLDFNIRFGPYQVKFDDAEAFIVPITPKYHCLLLPEAEIQGEFFPGQHPFGNSIRKAYLCNANIRRIKPGDILFFYRSGKHSGVTACGVVENTVVSNNPSQIARFVGKRTVYAFSEIETMCEKAVLAILFRMSRSLTEQLSLNNLVTQDVLKAAPQSTTTLSTESKIWLKNQFRM